MQKQTLHKKRRETYEHVSILKKNPKVLFIDNSMNLEKACKDLQWNHGASGIAESGMESQRRDVNSSLAVGTR